MRTTWIIARHQLRRVARNPGLILLLLAVPFTLAVIEYFAFGQTAAQGKLPPIQVLILDEDDSFLTRNLLSNVLSSGPLEETIRTEPVEDRDTARARFRKNEASALIVFPKGLGESIVKGRGGEIQIYPNPVQTFSPQIVESILEMLVLMGNDVYGHLVEPIDLFAKFIEEGRGPTDAEIVHINHLMNAAGPRFERLGQLQELDVQLQRPDRDPEKTEWGASQGQFFGYVFPGLVIFALFFISQILAVRLLRDRMAGMQRRLLTTPASGAAILFGGIIYLVIYLFLLVVILGIIASFVFGIRLREPAALLLLALGLAVFITGLQLTITGLSKTDRGAGFGGGIVIMLLAVAGGTFMPAETYPAFLQAIAFRTPNGAAQQGMVDLLVHGRSLAEIGTRLATTWIWGVLLLGTAIRFEGRRLIKR